MKEDKKRKSVFKQIASKRPQAARISSSGVKQQTSKGTCDGDEDDGTTIEAMVDTPAASISVASKDSVIMSDDQSTRSGLERADSESQPKGWHCETCTLENPINRKRCQACAARKPIVPTCLSSESLDSPRNRRLRSSPKKIHPLQEQPDTTIHVRLVEKLDTPEAKSKMNSSPMLIENCVSHKRVKTSVHARTEIDDNERNQHPSSENKCSERSANAEENVSESPCERLSSADSNSDEPNDGNAVESARPVPAPHDLVSPISGKEDYQQLQVTLARVLDTLDSMNKVIHNQTDEIRYLRESIINLETRLNVGGSHAEQEEASVSNDAPSSVSPEARHANDENVLTGADLLGDIEATSSGMKRFNRSKRNTSTSSQTSAVAPVLNAVNPDDLQNEEKAGRHSTSLNRDDIKGDQAVKEKLLLTPLSPAASTQTIDPDANSQVGAPAKVSVASNSSSKRLLKKCTNQKLPNYNARPWMTTKNSRQFINELKAANPKQTPFQRPGDSDDPLFKDSQQPNYAYKEVVRCHKDKKGLPCHDCDECRKWYQTLKDTGHEFSQDPLEFSRHRSRFQPHESPVDFWEMSFIDEIKARQVEEAKKPPSGN